METLRLNITSDPANLADVRRAVEALCARNGFVGETCEQVGLCVNEAMANVMRHAYGGAKDRPIELVAEVRDERVNLSLRDWGNGVDPLQLPPKKRDPDRPGGLGLVCLRQMMDEVRFIPQPDGMLLEMTRRRTPVGADEDAARTGGQCPVTPGEPQKEAG
jgi:anti-sigma regulatory factor (Ser/Thr protein kinase)